MKLSVGRDVPLEKTVICVISENGKIVKGAWRKVRPMASR